MRPARPRSSFARLAVLAVLAGGVCAYHPLRAVGATPPTAASASASPLRAGADAGTPGLAIAAYAWPTEATPEPKEEDWASATELEALQDGSTGTLRATCALRVLGSWLRLTCKPPWGSVGSLWGLAGDVSKVKASFLLNASLDAYKTPPTNTQEDLTRKMGASVTITIPATPGTALLLRLDGIMWEEEYDSSGVEIREGALIDVSWALGETHPTLRLRQ